MEKFLKYAYCKSSNPYMNYTQLNEAVLKVQHMLQYSRVILLQSSLIWQLTASLYSLLFGIMFTELY